MPTYDEKPWWELEGRPPPHEAQFEAERERLLEVRMLEWRQHQDERERRRARTSLPPPSLPSS